MNIGAYVHVPFCIARCYYCSFTSYALGKNAGATNYRQQIEPYIEALKKEVGIYKNVLKDEEIQLKSLYIGGGTPTCLSGGQLYLLLDALRTGFSYSNQIEITVEGNPGTISEEKLKVLQEQGCTRLSLGVQSFNNKELRVLGRIHSTRDVYNTYKLARKMGFANINLDLMYGLPGQSLEDWKKNLRELVSLGPEHISLYQLNLEKGTPFQHLYERGLLEIFDQEEAFYMYEEAIDYLRAKGYHHYEISNFARPGKESRHNQLYWHDEYYVGLGAGASGYLENIRYTNICNLIQYQETVNQGLRPIEQQEKIDRSLNMAETMFLGLRLLEGVNKRKFYQQFQVSVKDLYGNVIEPLKKQGLLRETETHIHLTRRGLYIANEVFMEFL